MSGVSASPIPAGNAPELRFDHLGVVVPDIAAGRAFLERALGVTHWTALIEDPALGVTVQFGTSATAGNSHGPAYELIAPLGDASPIATALRAGKNILNHLAYLTADIALSEAQLRAEGCHATGPAQAAIAYGGRPVQFFVSPLRFIIELIESPDHQHSFSAPPAVPPQQGRGLL